MEIGRIDSFRIVISEEKPMLIFHPDTGLQKAEAKPTNAELGTMIRHSFSKTWHMRVKRRTGGKTWKPVKQVPKMIRLQALLLDIPL